MKEFAHGGGVEAFAKELGCKLDEVIDLSSNINFIKPTIKIDFNKLNISSYPTYDKLYKAISKNYCIEPDELELYNGGSSAIFTLFRELNLKHCTIYSPAYLEYKKAAKRFGYEIDLINRFNHIDRFVKEGSFVIFVNPSTPDGEFYDIDKFMDKWIEKKCTILVDESFLDFCGGKSVIEYLKKYDKLYILKSMTKFYSSAGIRVGTIVSSKENIQRLRDNEPMWKLSEFDSNYLQEALKDSSFKKISKSINIKNNIMLYNLLSGCELFCEVRLSKANYILVKLKTLLATEFQEALKPYKIMVRDCGNFDFLDSSYVRIAVKSKNDINTLAKALENIK